MSEASCPAFEPSFNRSLKVRARDQRLSSNGGVLLLREMDSRLGLFDGLAEELHDPRRLDLVRYRIDELLRERVFARTLGYNVDDEVDLLCHDPAMRIATWNRPGERVLEERAASQPTQSRLTSMLAEYKQNREALRGSLAMTVVRHARAARSGRRPKHGTVDVDSAPLTVHGAQQGAAYNGYYREKMYHPLFASYAPGGDYDSGQPGEGFVHAMLRAGNVHTAEGAVRFIRRAVELSAELADRIDVRLDAGYTAGNVLDPLTEDGIRFVGRLATNSVLDGKAQPHLVRPVGRPPKEGYEKVIDLGPHQAESWKHAQRLLLVVVDKPDPKTGQLEFLPRFFFLITNWTSAERGAKELLEHYRRRGTFEDRIGELSQAIAPRLSSPRFGENEVHLLVSLLSLNLLGVLRSELERETGNGWDAGRVQRSVLKTAVRVTKASRRLIVDIALVAVGLWNRVADALGRWRRLPDQARPPGPRSRPWVPLPGHAHTHAVLRE